MNVITLNSASSRRALFFHLWFEKQPHIAVDGLHGVSKGAAVGRRPWVSNPAAGFPPVENRVHRISFEGDIEEETSISAGGRDEQAEAVR